MYLVYTFLPTLFFAFTNCSYSQVNSGSDLTDQISLGSAYLPSGQSCLNQEDKILLQLTEELKAGLSIRASLSKALSSIKPISTDSYLLGVLMKKVFDTAGLISLHDTGYNFLGDDRSYIGAIPKEVLIGIIREANLNKMQLKYLPSHPSPEVNFWFNKYFYWVNWHRYIQFGLL
jgi:hypothetical protein